MCKIALLLLSILVCAPAFAVDNTKDVQTRIFSYFLNRANEGDMGAQFIIGSRYEHGTGVERDLEKAYQWYAKAAAQGHPLAQQKMEDRVNPSAKIEKKEEATQAPQARVQAHAVHAAQLSHTAKAREPTLREQAVKTAQGQAVAKERLAQNTPAATKPSPTPIEPVIAKVVANEPPEIVVNTMDIVLKGQWKRNQNPVEYLPSVKTACLQVSDDEVICFSQELQKTVGTMSLVYTVKASLRNFAKNGEFSVQYLYNVIDIDNAKNPTSNQGQNDSSDITAKLGWQQPGHSLDCKAANEKAITCIKDKKYNLYFVQ